MFFKEIITFVTIIAILFTESSAQTRLRAPRDYEEALPASRSSFHTNVTTGEESEGTGNQTIPSKPYKGLHRFNHSLHSSEPLGCSQCLNEKYLSHYYEKGCKPMSGELICHKPCPKYFDCPKREHKRAPKGCEYKGRVYRVGEKIKIDNPCKKGCYCDENLDEKNVPNPTLRCADVDCFSNFKAPKPNCYNVYESGKCCPREQCVSERDFDPEFKCRFEAKQYSFGQKMHSKEDPCIECTCNENWSQNNPLNGTGCQKTKCYLHSNPDFIAGCLPIYHESTCCPIEYYCPPPEQHHCVFDGRKYRIGESVDIGRNDRTECKCVIPPDFTCIEKSSSNNRTKKAQTLEAPDYVKQFQTLPQIDITNRSNNPFNYPKLDEPSDCPPFIAGGLTCAGVNCTTIIDSNGCQACSCQRPCPQYKCRSSCRLVAVTPGECPKCKCD